MRTIFKRNNPLNIRYSKRNQWIGQVGEDNGFCVFDTAEHGLRAAFLLLKNYGRKGYNTLPLIIARWAPYIENPTASYIEFIAKRMIMLGYEVYDDKLNFQRLDLGNDEVVKDLVYCMCLFESGKRPQLKEIESALRSAGCLCCDDEPLGISGAPII